MNIEKSIEEIKIQDLIEHIRFGTQLKYDIKDYIYSIETLLTAYEREKEKNKNARERIEYYLVENMRLNDFDERNKELRKIEKILEE